jgi:hypothetical protein
MLCLLVLRRSGTFPRASRRSMDDRWSFGSDGVAQSEATTSIRTSSEGGFLPPQPNPTLPLPPPAPAPQTCLAKVLIFLSCQRSVRFASLSPRLASVLLELDDDFWTERTASTMMLPRSHHPRSLLLPSLPCWLFPCFVLLLAAVAQPAKADLLTLLLNATNAPPGALDKAQADAATFLQKFVNLEGSSYKSLAPGQEVYAVSTTGTTDNNAVRMLRGNGQEDEEDSEHESSSLREHRKLIDCPNACSTSGSLTCRLLGCAYCGRCRRRLRELLQGKQRQIESTLTSDLSAYCNGKPDCTIKAVIQRVNDDGTMSQAV